MLSSAAASPFMAHRRTGWTPRRLPGLGAWYDGKKAASFNDTGGAVNQWDDRSANANHMTGADPNRPLLAVGGGVVTVPGDRLTFTSLFDGSTDLTAFVVASVVDASSGHGTLMAGGSTGNTLFYVNTSSQLTWDAAAPVLAIPDPSVLNVLGFAYTGGDVDLFVNSETAGASQAGVGGSVSFTRIAAYAHLGAFGLDGTIRELVICTQLLGDADRAHLVAYLRKKWGTP